jgi:hypothetical protein
MPNINAPFGFRYVGRGDGAPPNFGSTVGFIANASGAIFYGDPLTLVNGLMVQAAVVGGGAQIAGVADTKFKWNSASFKRPIWNNYWPGTADSFGGANIEMTLTNDPLGIYETMATTGLVTQAQVGQYANFSAGAGGNTLNGVSSYSLNDATLNPVPGNLPFKLVYIEQQPKTDPTSVNNLIRVQPTNLNAFVS